MFSGERENWSNIMYGVCRFLCHVHVLSDHTQDLEQVFASDPQLCQQNI